MPASAELVAFVDAVMKDESDLPARRDAVAAAMSDEALVDAAAVIGNFERMNRIADATGIALDAPMIGLMSEVRDELAIESFGNASKTPRPNAVQRLLGGVMRAALPLLSRVAKRL